MREIKFRVWNKEENYMSEPMTLIEIVNNRNGSIENPIWLEWTGLKDKNGKEIYEGDILEVDGVINNYIGEVIWYQFEYFPMVGHLPAKSNNTNGWAIKEKDGFYDLNPKTVEVIGNIWENPELLAARYDKSQDD